MVEGPLLVAHRSGNTAATARRDVDRADAIELDVHVHRGAVVVRHAKILWPTSLLWERWYFLPRNTPVPEIAEVLAAVDEEVTLLLDLKCFSRRAARRIRRAVPAGRTLIVSSRSWWVLGVFADRPGTTRLRSCGNAMQLRLATMAPGLGAELGVVAHQRLLDRPSIDRVLGRTPHLFTWAVASTDRAAELVEAGVTGLIVDDLTIEWPSLDP